MHMFAATEFARPRKFKHGGKVGFWGVWCKGTRGICWTPSSSWDSRGEKRRDYSKRQCSTDLRNLQPGQELYRDTGCRSTRRISMLETAEPRALQSQELWMRISFLPPYRTQTVLTLSCQELGIQRNYNKALNVHDGQWGKNRNSSRPGGLCIYSLWQISNILSKNKKMHPVPEKHRWNNYLQMLNSAPVNFLQEDSSQLSLPLAICSFLAANKNPVNSSNSAGPKAKVFFSLKTFCSVLDWEQ